MIHESKGTGLKRALQIRKKKQKVEPLQEEEKDSQVEVVVEKKKSKEVVGKEG